jgi:hypothetical protein
MFADQYPESSSCWIRLEHFVPGELIRVATDPAALSSQDANGASAIWNFWTSSGTGSFGIRRQIYARPQVSSLGLSSVMAKTGVLSLLVASLNEGTTVEHSGVDAMSPWMSSIDLQIYLCAKKQTSKVTLYFDSTSHATASVGLCGQNMLMSNDIPNATFNWINDYSGP